MANGTTFEWLAKSGYAARGVVFLLIAGLALFSGFAGNKPDTKPALNTLLQQPFGRLWLAAVALGLLGFVGWRLAQSVADADGHGSGAKALITRAALFGSAATYMGLALYAFAEALYIGGDDSSGEKGLAQWIMSQPFGAYLAMIVGSGFIVGGGVTMYKGVSRKFRRYLRLPQAAGAPIIALCVYGLAARGLIFAIVGGFLVYAGFTVDPQSAGGTGDALAWVRQLPFGQLIYTLVAVGLAAFGVYNLIEARYRIVRTPSLAHVRRTLPI